MACTIILVQHALTQWNVDRRTQGHTDTPLNPMGHEMAKALAEHLKNEEIHAIFSSDLRRAYETVEILSKQKNITVQKNANLREGRWESQEKESEYEVLPFNVESESAEDVKKRVIDTLTDIAQRHMDQNVLVVSHGGPLHNFTDFVRESSKSSFDKYKGIRTSINRFKYEDGKWECMEINNDEHLKNMSRDQISKDAG